MNSAIERLLGLRVKDVMQRDLLTISESDSIQTAAEKLFSAEVTGAPVVDGSGRCVGVLSGSDFVGREANGPGHEIQVVVQPNPEAPYNIEVLNDNLVRSHMCPEVLSVNPESNIMDAARVMCQNHVHRLIVLDDHDHPVAIVSSLDLIAAMVAAVEE